MDGEDLIFKDLYKVRFNKDENFVINGKVYTMIKLIGEGAYGKVYKAEMNGSLYAVKFIRPEHKRSFDVERTILSVIKEKTDQCKIESVACYVDAMENRDSLILVTKFIEGETLDSFVPSVGFKNIKLLYRICKNIILSYMDLNKAGIIHRDIKPQNIMINPKNYKITFIDFGLSCEPLSVHPWLNCEGTHGSALYNAPEVFKKKRQTLQSDIFALGIVFYYVASKQDLIYDPTGKTGKESIFAYVKNLTHNTNRLPIKVENFEARTLIEDMISHEPKDRPSLEEILKRIEDFLNY